jgi:SAM-dependent methyltransferase
MIENKQYKSYDEYLNHQIEKTSRKDLREKWEGRKESRTSCFLRRLGHLKEQSEGKDVLCLAARMGDEVQAFLELGAKSAIGIDLVPYPPLVIEGDIHKPPFENGSFDIVYTNSMDHALKPKDVLTQVRRLLKPDGIMVLDFDPGNFGRYESTKIDSIDDIAALTKMQLIKVDYDLPVMYDGQVQLIFSGNPINE